jgi:hypothetical protein
MNRTFLEYYRCPDRYADFRLPDDVTNGGVSGECRLAADLMRCGVLPSGLCDTTADNGVTAVCSGVSVSESTGIPQLDLNDVVTHIRQERYVKRTEKSFLKNLIQGAYYLARPCLPVSVRRHLQRAWLNGWDRIPFPTWPVDCTVDKVFEKMMGLSLQANGGIPVPFIWFWPEGKSSCAIMTHDVETAAGLEFCKTLMDLDDSFAIKSSFQIIPENRYAVVPDLLEQMRNRGFEINVHDLRHDGHLFRELTIFQAQAEKINNYAREFGSKGFRSGALYRRPEWYGAFRFSYDMSVPNVGHLEAQGGGCCTVMPFYIDDILELPVTTTQDYSLLNILGSHSIDLWRQQIDTIRQQHGLISFIVHPDYLNTASARGTYQDLLRHLSNLRLEANVWIPTPGEVDSWWRKRNQMKLVHDGSNWRIEGEDACRAKIAYASLCRESVVYSVV